MNSYLTPGEAIEYVAVQKGLGGIKISPAAVVATNKRFLIYRPTILGTAKFEDYLWVDLLDARISEGMMSATLTFRTVKGTEATIDSLPKTQARRLYTMAQAQEETMRTRRREMELEDKRAAAGGFVMHQPAAVPTPTPAPVAMAAPDPVERLKKLKAMLDADLIDKGEYDAQKARILADL